MNRQPTLEGELVVVRPLREADFDELYAVAADPLLWEQHPESERWREDVFRDYFDDHLGSGGALAVVERAAGNLIGATRYDNYDPEASEVEIGWTFLARPYWGGVYNADLKRVMLEHAFKSVETVVFLIGARNLRSRRAVEKLGAIECGARRGMLLYTVRRQQSASDHTAPAVTIGVADVGDAHEAAILADVKRAEYERYSPVFWRPAENAVERHEPWLAKCLSDEGYSSFAARSGAMLVGIAIAAHGVSPPPFRSDPEASWLVDDFFVLSADGWRTVGASLLEAVEQAADEQGATRMIVLSARRDEPKQAMLAEAGYERGASWWVHPVQAAVGDLPVLRDTDAVVGPAPPVYDPGGLTALALEMRDPSDVSTFDTWASASNAVLAIVPARSSNPVLEHALSEAGYEPASDWFIKNI